MPRKSRRIWPWVVGGALAALALLAVVNWQTTLLATAAVLAEKRPALLREAEWAAPASARRFNARFAAGVPERDLTAWLASNRFKIDPAAGTAARDIAGFPCTEKIAVAWQADGARKLTRASAVVTQIACL